MLRQVRIGVDVSRAPRNGQVDGIHAYTKTLVQALQRNSSVVYTLGETDYSNRRSLKGFMAYWWAQQVRLPLDQKGLDIDVLHFPGNVQSVWVPGRARKVVTVHDLFFLDLGRAQDFYYTTLFHKTIRRADALVFPSKYAQEVFTDRFGRFPLKAVIPFPVRESIRRVPVDQTNLRPYVLAQGSRSPLKRLDTVLGSYKALRNLSGMDFDLVLFGGDGAVRAMAADMPGVRYVYRPSDSVLSQLYSGAACTWVLSENEGYGLPVLEALKCGSPVVAMAVGALRETAGYGAITMSSRDPVAIAGATLKTMNANPASRSERHVEVGMGYGDFATAMVGFYERVLNAHT